MRLLSLWWLLILALGCQGAAPRVKSPADEELSPRELSFDSIYVGQQRTVPLQFQYNGQPVPFSQLLIADRSGEDGSSPFTLIRDESSELRANLEITGRRAGIQTATMRVAVGSRGFAVPMSIEVKPVPSCDAPDVCQQASFDLAQEKCVVSSRPDGSECSPNCETAAFCEQGSCVTAYVTEKAFDCDFSLSSAPPLEPIWIAQPKLNRLGARVIDEQDNIYFAEQTEVALPSGGAGNVVALDRQGELRWLMQLNGLNVGTAQLALAGAYLLVAKQGAEPSFQVRLQSTGDLVWGIAKEVSHFAAMGENELLLMERDANGEGVLVARELMTGAIDRRYVMPPSSDLTSLVTDGAGSFLATISGENQQNVLLGGTIVGNHEWSRDLSGLDLGRAIAVGANQAIMEGGVLIDMRTGQTTFRLPHAGNAHSVMNAVVNENDVAFVDYEHQCYGTRVLSRVSLDGTAPIKTCLMPKKWSGKALPQSMAPTADGGVAVLSGLLGALLYDQDLQLKASIYLALDYDMFGSGPSGLDPLVITGGIQSVRQERTADMIMNYPIPELVLAPHGWLGPRGGPKLNSRPE